MRRPCVCDRVQPGTEYSRDQCRWCWLFHHRPDYRALWSAPSDGEPAGAALLAQGRRHEEPAGAGTGLSARPVCRLRGEELRQAPCSSCRGSVQVKVFACVAFGECTAGRKIDAVACCSACDRYEPAL
jgi:hypothetical protein